MNPKQTPSRPGLVAALVLLLLPVCAASQGRIYHVDCRSTATTPLPDLSAPLHSLAEVNRLVLGPGDRLLFARGTVCDGTLSPQGSGSAAAPVLIASYGDGPLPRIQAPAGAESSLHLHNQEFWTISQLDLAGGTHAGVSITASQGTMHQILLRDLRVHDVTGAVRAKEDGLVTIHPVTPTASFDGILVDGVQAFNTSQWAGIFIAGASVARRSTHVEVRNSTVHDVQGDGIVLFVVSDGAIRNSTAWHTGMQHSYTIGTPNAIWTWRCNRCTVEGNEAFLSDSPGVDGGSFDIDFGNVDNRVLTNFGHHTQGYCVSVFGAFENTSNSEVAGNTCLFNGLSPRLAQRQGAILFMTWSDGAIRNVTVHDNKILWEPPSATPPFQSGSHTEIQGLTLSNNVVLSTSPVFFSPELQQYAAGNHSCFSAATVQGAALLDELAAVVASPETCNRSSAPASREQLPGSSRKSARPVRTGPYQLTLELPSPNDDYDNNLARTWLATLNSMIVQFGSKGISFGVATCAEDAAVNRLVADMLPPERHVSLASGTCAPTARARFMLSSSQYGREPLNDRVATWLALARHVGQPVYGQLPTLELQAHD